MTDDADERAKAIMTKRLLGQLTTDALLDSYLPLASEVIADDIAAAIRESVAAERERIAADLIEQGRAANMDFADAMDWAANRIREGKSWRSCRASIIHPSHCVCVFNCSDN